MLQFYSYNVLMHEFHNFPLLNEWKYSTKFVAGASAGFIATTVSFPFDTIRTRLVAQSNNHIVYKGICHSCRQVECHKSHLPLNQILFDEIYFQLHNTT